MTKATPTCKYRGVIKVDRRNNPYVAQGSHMGVRRHLGAFATEEEAVRAYDAFCRQVGHPERANFPEPEPHAGSNGVPLDSKPDPRQPGPPPPARSPRLAEAEALGAAVMLIESLPHAAAVRVLGTLAAMFREER